MSKDRPMKKVGRNALSKPGNMQGELNRVRRRSCTDSSGLMDTYETGAFLKDEFAMPGHGDTGDKDFMPVMTKERGKQI